MARILSRSSILVLGMFALLGLGSCSDFDELMCGAQAPGDILIGMLLPSHAEVVSIQTRRQPDGFVCKDFDLVPFIRSLAVIHTIEEINSSNFLPGVQLGYVMCDTCSDATKALYNAELLLSINQSLPILSDYTNYIPLIKAVIGARYSEVSIAVARLLSVFMVPQMCSTSSSTALSDKERFLTFMRTIPSDVFQTKALAKLMAHFHWEWVGVVYGDDEYGKEAYQSFLQDAATESLCVAYQEMVPEYLDKTSSERRIMEIARTIRSSTAKVVLLIMKPELVASLFMEMIRTNTSRIWIASDAWSTNRILAHMDGINKVGDIFGITFVGGKIPGFDQYLRNLRPSPGGFNRFMEEYKMLRFNCTPELQEYQDCLTQSSPSSCTKPDVPPMKSEQACSGLNPEEADDDYLTEEFELNEAYKERVGTYALAYAIRTLLKCNATSCPGDKAFPPWKLLQVLKNVSFILDNQTISFNENGDMNDGYDLVMWTKHKETRHFEGIGRYLISENKLSINLPTHNNTVPQSRCSDSCTAGFKKNVLNVSCCYNCVKCLAGTFSNSSDQQDCQQCQKGTWSEDGSTQCQRIQEIYLRWSDGHPIALVTSAVLGEVLLLVILIVFLLNKESPPMKRAEVKMSCVMMAGLAVSFASVICFIGRPNDALCQARQTMYGIGFALCVSCILVKSFRIFLAFLACDPEKQHRLDKIYKPTANIITLTSLQVVICALWLIFDFPKVADTPKISLNILHQCDVGAKFIGFGIMLSYIALLAFVGFVLAFKGRKVPQEFSETGYIIFSMLMYLFVWVCFIPIYIMKSEQSATIQASAILVSSYGIVFCHFLPKCYDVALLRTEKGGKIRERMSKMLHMRFRHIDIVHIDVGVSN